MTVNSILRKVGHLSVVESKLLDTAINNKQEVVKRLSNEVKNNNLSELPLPQKDVKAMRDHFARKLTFYRKQDNTKWRDWPTKTVPKQQPADKKTDQFQKTCCKE